MQGPIAQLAWVFVFFAIVAAVTTSVPVLRKRSHPAIIPALYFGTALTALFATVSAVLFYTASH